MISIRQATLKDIEVLTTLRIRFLKELGEIEGAEAEKKLGDAISRYMQEKIPLKEFIAYIAENRGEIIATSGLVILQKVPLGSNPTGKEGYILNMYTLPEWRKKGIATDLLKHLIDYCHNIGVMKLSLHAEEAGKGIYEKLGFVGPTTEMLFQE